MSPDDIKKRIVNEIKARAYDDKYVDRGEEREIIQIAIQLGVTVENAGLLSRLPPRIFRKHCLISSPSVGAWYCHWVRRSKPCF